jgi:hypothetical protein
MTNHHLSRGHHYYHCAKCGWRWQSKPQSECPGVLRYEWHTKPEHLLSPTQLKMAGFSLAPDQPRRGMVQSGDGKRWHWLFDIQEAISKKGRSPAEGLKILKEKLVKKQQREYLNLLDNRLTNLESRLQHLGSVLAVDNSNSTNRNYWEEIRWLGIKRLRHEIISDCKSAKWYLQKLQSLQPQPQLGDMVLGGQQPQPQLGDMVLGGVEK